MFAAKLYLDKTTPLYYADKDGAEELQTSFSLKKEEAEREFKLWRELAPQYSHYCKVLTLNDVPSLTMPFFPPIAIVQRHEALPQIKERLDEFADKGYFYSEEVCWTHVGYREIDGMMQITMIDLGSLADAVDATVTAIVRSEMVEKQMRVLLHTINEPVSQVTPAIP